MVKIGLFYSSVRKMPSAARIIYRKDNEILGEYRIKSELFFIKSQHNCGLCLLILRVA